MILLLDHRTILVKGIAGGKDEKQDPGNNVIQGTENHFSISINQLFET